MGGIITDLFSSPSQQAQQAGQQAQQLSQNEINQEEAYVSNAEAQERGAIAGIGNNPYFGGSGGSNPNGSPVGAPVALDPSDTVSFGPTGVSPTAAANASSGGATPKGLEAQPNAAASWAQMIGGTVPSSNSASTPTPQPVARNANVRAL
jgi:hypothetical protein